MRIIEPVIQSFVIKIWLEGTALKDGAVSWRGQITHVPGGDRRYFNSLDTISQFIEPYLRRLDDEHELVEME